MGSRTGGNTEPMKFVRKWGPAASDAGSGGGSENGAEHDVKSEVKEESMEYEGPVPPPDYGHSAKMESPAHNGAEKSERRRSRSRDRDRSDRSDRKKKRSRSRERDRGDRDRDRDRRRSRSRDRDRRRSSRDRRRSRDRSPRRSRSRSRDRGRRSEKIEEKEKTPEIEVTGPRVINATPAASTLLNPLVRPDILEAAAATGAIPSEILERKRERKSRWSTTKSFVPGMPTVLPANLTEEQTRTYLLQLEVEDCTRKLRLGDFLGPINPLERSPSPEPIYDQNGKRLNTREVRKRQELEQTRHEKISALLMANPDYKPPADYRRLPHMRPFDKVWIPQDDYPHLNFVGLLIGPRGNTLKALEMESGTKIIIRGKGSVKEGKLVRRDGTPFPGENEPLHAYVTGPDRDSIKKACDKIKAIIAEASTIGPDGGNTHLRALQLRELALLNGTMRPEDMVNTSRCQNCGSDQHKSWECQDLMNVTATIICTACGGAGHISRDCKNPRPGFVEGQGDAGLDDEYSALMEELGERPVGGRGVGAANRGRQGPPPYIGPGGAPPPLNAAGRGFGAFPPPPPAPAQQNQSSGGYSTGPAYPGAYAYTTGAARGGYGGWGGHQGGGGWGGMPAPVPPPPPPMMGFPPPPPPPPVPAPPGGGYGDLSAFLAPPAPPPPPPS